MYVTEKKGQWEYHDSQMQYKFSHDHESASMSEHESPDEWESPSAPHKVHKHVSEASPPVQSATGPMYGHSHAMTTAKVTVKPKKAKLYHHGYAPMKHSQDPKYGCAPMITAPQYVIHDCFIAREVPVVHPVIHVNRYHIVNIPTHYYQHSLQNVFVDRLYFNKPSPPPSTSD